jgi:putative ABC transport system ATP-binding protein
MTTDVAVALDGLTRTYRSRSGEVHALRGVTHLFHAGTFTAVMGPSGSGKSTLLQLAAGLDRPTRGRVVVGGTALDGLDPTALTRFRRRSMAFVFQAYNLLDALTAYENVALPVRLAGRAVERARVLDALARVGLTEQAGRRPPELSGGQQQRVAIARALAASPRLLVADEPTGQLDAETGLAVMALLRGIVEAEGVTALVSTHDPVMMALADRVIRISDGQLEPPA